MLPRLSRTAAPLSTARIRGFYDWIGRRHDWAERYEGQAKARALQALDLAADQRVLDVGAGTGLEHRAIVRAIGRGGSAVAVDLSPVMLCLVRQRTGSPVANADARRLPFTDGAFDRVFCGYVLDLLPEGDLARTMEEFARVTTPGGRIALVSMTQGRSPVSRLVVGAWKALYRANPIWCGGCRPLDLSSLARGLGLRVEMSERIEQLGFPSEILVIRI